MLAGSLILMVAAAFGTAALSRLELPLERSLWLLGGTVLGLVVYTVFSYALSPFLPGARLASAPVWLAMGGWAARELRSERFRDRWRASSVDRVGFALWGAATMLFFPIGTKLLFEKDGALWVGILSAFGDVAWHVASIQAFVAGQPFPPVNPIHAGHPLVYPHLVDWMSATMVAWGSPLTTSLTAPAVLFAPVFVALYYGIVRDLTGRRLAAGLAVVLFVGTGSVWGAHRFGADWSASGKGLIPFLLHLPIKDYSGAGGGNDGLHFLNPVITLLMPQRSLLLGFPLAFLILYLWSRGRDRASAVAAGLLAGTMPGFHAHTVLALAPALLWLTPRERWREAPWALGAAAILGVPGVLYYLLLGSVGNHLSVHWGWMHGGENWFLYWLRNTGFVLPVGAALAWRFRSSTAGRLAAAGLTLFAIANTFQFARWVWDNYKLLIYAWLFLLPAVGLGCAQFLDRYPRRWARAAVVVLVLCHIPSGMLDLWKVWLPTSKAWVEWDGPARAAAEAIRSFTPPLARVAAAPIHNSPIFLAGRIAYLGYPGHVWSHGGDSSKRERDLKAYFNAELESLPEPVDFVLIGPAEKNHFPGASRKIPGERVFGDGTYELFRVNASK